MSATVRLICGKVGSGKTTYAKEYCETHENAIILSVDECMKEFVKECPGREARLEMEHNILHYFYSLALKLLEQGIDVLIDHGFWLKEERLEAANFFMSRYKGTILVYVPCSEEKQKEQLKKRNEEETQNIITEEMRVKFNQWFEEPTRSEVSAYMFVYIFTRDEEVWKLKDE